ncbi:MAG: hypothetical protein S4CHLAM2_18170 [Chlamydiales bacterium]|nr:hypothetical protein [Chlamydiales bacterium]
MASASTPGQLVSRTYHPAPLTLYNEPDEVMEVSVYLKNGRKYTCFRTVRRQADDDFATLSFIKRVFASVCIGAVLGRILDPGRVGAFLGAGIGFILNIIHSASQSNTPQTTREN